MNTPRTIQTKRTRPKAGFRKLHAATRSSKKRKQRAATTAAPEDLGEVPGVGVPLALVVILLLHVAAIAGIWIHDRWSSSADLEATKPALKEDAQPVRIAELDYHLVDSGDTAGSIASRYGVEVESLLKVNEGISEYEAGWKINIPARRVEATPPAGVVPGGPAVPERVAIGPVERPTIQTTDENTLPGSRPGELVELGRPPAEAEPTGEPVFIRPVAPVRPAGMAQPGTRHVVKSGETLWRIARNNGITVDALKEANPGVSASALKIGAELIIPAER